MDSMKLRTALAAAIFDRIEVETTPAGLLVSTPFSYSDGDRIELVVVDQDGLIDVTDGGYTGMRLSLAGVDVESSAVAEFARASTKHLFSLGSPATELAQACSADDVGEAMIAVTEAAIRVDGARFIVPRKRPRKFSTRVTSHLKEIVAAQNSEALVSPNYRLHTQGGRTRTVTAAISVDGRQPVAVQAVNTTGESAEQQVANCYYAFDAVVEGELSEKIAVLRGTEDTVDAGVVRDLRAVATEVVYSDSREFDQAILRFLEPALS